MPFTDEELFRVNEEGSSMKAPWVQMLTLLLVYLCLPENNVYGQDPRDEAGKITVITVQPKAATVTRQYACRIRARRHMDILSGSAECFAHVPDFNQ
jgi:hypothetical protein